MKKTGLLLLFLAVIHTIESFYSFQPTHHRYLYESSTRLHNEDEIHSNPIYSDGIFPIVLHSDTRKSEKRSVSYELTSSFDINRQASNLANFRGPSAFDMDLRWKQKPQRILFLAKPDYEIMSKMFDSLLYLWDKDVEIVFEEPIFQYLNTYKPFKMWLESRKFVEKEYRRRLSFFSENDMDIDLIITFGGDGLLLHCNRLFPSSPIPPVMCFDFGSFGFLTPFQYEEFQQEIENVFSGNSVVTLRMRLSCEIYSQGRTRDSYTVLNEAVVDRGSSPFLALLDLTCNSHYLTTLQGDGIIFATPTGSTAYSLSAGGSIVYPSVPAILVTPICAHSLSFRPMILPDSAKLTCDVPIQGRGNAWVSFDGKHRQKLLRGETLKVRMSPFPMPTINRRNFTEDWINSLREGFMFNLRPRQKPLANSPDVTV